MVWTIKIYHINDKTFKLALEDSPTQLNTITFKESKNNNAWSVLDFEQDIQSLSALYTISNALITLAKSSNVQYIIDSTKNNDLSYLYSKYHFEPRRCTERKFSLKIDTLKRVFFTSDTHFGHSGIIKMDERPFKDIKEHDKVLIDNWNSIVHPDDTVYHLGDFTFRSEEPVSYYVRQLNGTINLILGNHDYHQRVTKGAAFCTELFNSVEDIDYIAAPNRKKVMLCHYALRVWRGSNRGMYHLHGHSHGNLPRHGKSMDVGINTNNYYPYCYPHIEDIVTQCKENIDHHPKESK